MNFQTLHRRALLAAFLLFIIPSAVHADILVVANGPQATNFQAYVNEHKKDFNFVPKPILYSTIQSAINNTKNGDTVVVADGTYSGLGNVDLDFHGKNIVVKSANGAGSCTIDCQGSAAHPHRGFFLHSGETSAATIDGFTIKNGWASVTTEDGTYGDGGGLLAIGSSPTITNCNFTGNTSAGGFGGGISIFPQSGASLTVTGCSFTGNKSLADVSGGSGFGGGLFISSGGNVTVTKCIFNKNTAFAGGAMHIQTRGGNSFIDHCQFTVNTVGNDSDSGEGGGLYMIADNGGLSVISNCEFSDNAAYGGAAFGGGLSLNAGGGDSPTVIGCDFSGNTVDGDGGGGLFLGTDASSTSPNVTNCTFSGNEASLGFGDGGGIYAQVYGGPLNVSGCEFTNNQATSGGGLSVYPNLVTVTNSTFFGNEAQIGGGVDGDSVSATNCTFSQNLVDTGSGILSGGYVVSATNCTFSNNIGIKSGDYNIGASAIVGGSVNVTNCILYGDIAFSANGNSVGSEITGGTVTATYNDIQYYTYDPNTNAYVQAIYPEYYTYDSATNTTVLYDPTTKTYGPNAHSGTHTINANPSFADADLHLKSGSPCLGKGTATGAPDTDKDGRPRPKTPSLGAYEVGPIPLTITSAKLGLPRLVYEFGGQLVLDEKVYLQGTGSGNVTGHWTIAGDVHMTTPQTMNVALLPSAWTEAGELTLPWAQVEKKQFTIIFQPDTPASNATPTVDAVVTGFRPDINGWAESNPTKNSLGDAGNCLGMVATALYYYNHPPLPYNSPAKRGEVYDHFIGLTTDAQGKGNQWKNAYDVPRAFILPNDPLRSRVEADTIQQQLRQFPAIICIFGDNYLGIDEAIHGSDHAVLATAGYVSSSLINDTNADNGTGMLFGPVVINNIRSFSFYDPNYPDELNGIYFDVNGVLYLYQYPFMKSGMYTSFRNILATGYNYVPLSP